MGIQFRGAAQAAVVGAVAWLGAVGCGGGGSLSLTELHDALLPAVCHLVVLCGQLPDESTCRATQQEEPHFYASLPRLVAAGRIAYDGQKARACIDALNALSSCDHSIVRAPGALPECQQALVGRVAAGGDCFFNDECAGDGTGPGSCTPSAPDCDSFRQCCPGTCAARTPIVAAGGDCTDLTSRCAPATTCVTSPGQASRTCQPLGATVGASCMTVPCAGSLYCDPVTITCQRGAAEGGACNPALNNQDCDDPRDRCDSSAVCLPRSAVGAACASDGECVQWATCDLTSHTCLALPSVGQSCPAGDVPRCLGGASCDGPTNTCTLLPVGGSCL